MATASRKRLPGLKPDRLLVIIVFNVVLGFEQFTAFHFRSFRLAPAKNVRLDADADCGMQIKCVGLYQA